MNPSFPIQRPGVVNSPSGSLITDPHLSNPAPPTSNQWAALDTNLDLQRTLCKAAASGQLNQDQMMSFGAYMKGNPNALKMFQLELSAHQHQQIAQQQQQQQQQQQLKRQQQQHHSSPPPQHQEQDKNFQPAHQIANGSNGYIINSHPTSQAPLPMASSMSHYQQPVASSPPQSIHQRPSEFTMASNDSTLTQLIAQYRQAMDGWNNLKLSLAEREAAGQRVRELRDLMTSRMSQLGVRSVSATNGPSPAPPGSSQHSNTQSVAQTGTPQHPNEVQRAQLSAAYQRQQQMMSGMQYVSQSNANIVRPLSSNLLAAPTPIPRQTLNISGRNSPAPNLSNNQPMIHPISRPGSSQQPISGGPASSPPAMSSAASPPNSSTNDLTKRRVASRPPAKKNAQSIGTPNSNAGSPMSQLVNLAPSPHPVVTSLANTHPTTQANSQFSNSNANHNATQGSPLALRPSQSPAPPKERSLSPASVSATAAAAEPVAKAPRVHQTQAAGNSQPTPPGPVPNLASQQHSAIAAQQQQSLAPSTVGPAATTNQAAHSAPRELSNAHSAPPVPPAPLTFPPPRATLTGGHATSSTLAGSLIHRPPTNGVNAALGQASGSHESTRGAEATSANRIISKRKIQELVESIDPSERLESEVEDLLLELADEFIDSVTRFSCQLAKHRKSDRLETKDIQLHLERSWNIRIPGFANDEIRQSQSRRINALPSYQSRVAMVREAIRKRRSNN